MSIIRLTVRTFQSVEHANMFVVMSEKIASESHNTDLKLNMKIIQNVDQKNQVTSIWEYDDEKHMKEVRSYLSQYNSIPNSLSPKEIAYHGEVKVSANNKEEVIRDFIKVSNKFNLYLENFNYISHIDFSKSH